MQMPMATPLVCKKWEESKEKLLRLRTSSAKRMRVSVEGDWLGLQEMKKWRYTDLQELYVHGEDEVLGVGKLKVLEKMETVGYITDVGREFLDKSDKNGVEGEGDELGGVGANRDNGATRAIGFNDFGKEIETGGVGLGTIRLEAVDGCSPKMMMLLVHWEMMIRGGIMIEGTVGGGVRELASGISNVE
eukprot:g32579.t1